GCCLCREWPLCRSSPYCGARFGASHRPGQRSFGGRASTEYRALSDELTAARYESRRCPPPTIATSSSLPHTCSIHERKQETLVRSFAVRRSRLINRDFFLELRGQCAVALRLRQPQSALRDLNRLRELPDLRIGRRQCVANDQIRAARKLIGLSSQFECFVPISQ